MRNIICYQNETYRELRIDERIEYVRKMNNKIKQRDDDIEMSRA